jgi:hypothetical protein
VIVGVHWELASGDTKSNFLQNRVLLGKGGAQIVAAHCTGLAKLGVCKQMGQVGQYFDDSVIVIAPTHLFGGLL